MREPTLANSADRLYPNEEYIPTAHVGSLLQEARLRHGQDLRIVAEDLRIKYYHLVAIEAGRFGDLPGPTYVTGFIRAYAEYLGLDAEDIVRRYKDEPKGTQDSGSLDFPTTTRDGGMPAGIFLLVALILAGVAYGAWFWMSSSGKTVGELVAEVSTQVETLWNDAAGMLDSGDEPVLVPPLEETDPAEPPAPTREAGTGDGPAIAAPSEPAPRAGDGLAALNPPEESDTPGLRGQPEADAPDVFGADDASQAEPSSPPSVPDDPAPAESDATARGDDDAGPDSGAEIDPATPDPATPDPVAADGEQVDERPADVGGAPIPPETPQAVTAADETTLDTTANAPPTEEADRTAQAEEAPANPADTSDPTRADDGALSDTPSAPSPDTPSDTPSVNMDEAVTDPNPDSDAPDVGPTAPEDGVGDPPEVPEVGVTPEPADSEASAPQETDNTATDDDGTADEEVPAYVGRAAPSDVQAITRDSRIVLRANRDAWIQVRRGGDLVVRRLLRRGDTYAVPTGSGYTLNTSNAGGLEVYIDGRRVRNLGPVGAARNGIRLSPGALN